MRYSVSDAFDFIAGRRGELIPPRRLYFLAGDSDRAAYKKIGEAFLGYFKDLAGLKPDEKVLEVGCGTGRMASALTQYLSRHGIYRGFDIVPRWVKWCQKNITPRYPNFTFDLADIYNKYYHPAGRRTASGYIFPYLNGYFDFVFLTSVFTHMLPSDMEHYISEIGRVLRKGRRCCITFFLLNDEARRYCREGGSIFNFTHECGNYYTASPGTPEASIAYNEEFIVELYRKRGLDIAYPIRYGSWCGRPSSLSYQDIIVAAKK
ncbi:MAG: class I SAM-dependent methyltransferase [Candidatus Aureabacteria bacterium]|nr:class I SAM-dependent methyltransferase [Candidatus Auribacterota bacterium]